MTDKKKQDEEIEDTDESQKPEQAPYTGEADDNEQGGIPQGSGKGPGGG